MTLTGLIEELRSNILRDVSDAVSADELDHLWSDQSLTNYINDAYFRFCQRTQYIQDASTQAVCEITLVAGQVDYPLHEAIIQVLSVEYGNVILPLRSANEYMGRPADTVGRSPVRRCDPPYLSGAVPDYEIGTLRVLGTPLAEHDGQTLQLRVTRYPLTRLSLDDAETQLEIPERFHLDMLEWAAFRALRNHDPDGEAMAKASAHSTRFERAIQEVRAERRARTMTRIGFVGSQGW